MIVLQIRKYPVVSSKPLVSYRIIDCTAVYPMVMFISATHC